MVTFYAFTHFSEIFIASIQNVWMGPKGAKGKNFLWLLMKDEWKLSPFEIFLFFIETTYSWVLAMSLCFHTWLPFLTVLMQTIHHSATLKLGIQSEIGFTFEYFFITFKLFPPSPSTFAFAHFSLWKWN